MILNVETTGAAVRPKSGALKAQSNLSVRRTRYYSAWQQDTASQKRSENPISRTFRTHARRWKSDTQFISSLSEKYLHPSYARIIGLGWAALPLILGSLKRNPDDWYYALRAITGENPVPDTAAGNMPEMSRLWLKWGRERGLV